MQVERHEEKSPGPQPTSVNDFQSAVLLLWDEHVRKDLLFGNKLRFCKSCVCFFYHGEAGADHPPEDTCLVKDYFIEAKITSPTRLANFLWGLNMNLSCFPPAAGNFFAIKHQPKPLASPMASLSPHLASIQAKA